MNRTDRTWLCLGVFLLALTGVSAQTPPRETPLTETTWTKTDSTSISPTGWTALKIEPDKWRLAETPNFILHYRRMTEARKVAREIEFDLAFIAKTLAAKPDQYARKSHVYVFEDEDEWQLFVSESNAPPWSSSFAMGDELFLNVRQQGGGSSFDSQTLAHETTHAVIARIYRSKRWPLWLNEGFAEYMGGATVAARKNQTIKRQQKRLENTGMSLLAMASLEEYPKSLEDVSKLYQSSELFIRFLMSKHPPAQFNTFIGLLLDGRPLPEAVQGAYGTTYPDFAAFEKAWKKFAERS